MRDDSALFFHETTVLVESNLHALLNNVADWDQILCDSRNMQDIFNIGLLTFCAERNIADVPNRVLVSSLVSTYGSLRLS